MNYFLKTVKKFKILDQVKHNIMLREEGYMKHKKTNKVLHLI